MNGRVRIVFFGTPDFAVPVLRALAGAPWAEVAGVVTQPDRPAGRRQTLTPPPVKRAAQELGLPVWQPERVRAPEALEAIARLEPDVCVTAAYGQILPQRLLDIPRRGCLNVHASLLPRWRGAAPIHRAILAGDERTGVTLMEMVAALDAGPIVGAREIPIDPDDDAGTLHDKLAALGAALVLELLPDYVAGRVIPQPQPEDGVTYADRITRADEWIDWQRPVREVHNQVRGLRPWPGASAQVDGGALKVWRTAPATAVEVPAEPGVVRMFPDVGVAVRCADGWLRMDEVQPAGRRRMPAADWWRGLRRDEVRMDVAEPLPDGRSDG
ncbi:methionyl-tRNA formyltransferase [Alicyclobacillus macrosporangiidus]|uniref:methionyl-tRNA formyltransferase n=1 Tax=Alicyclobacillus macrosporangiidus TaxID=392015 RepID=UPI00049678F5|nr:methionyl-tRNA formyltransferase [Alicyclobacillus macrosporangiidus]